MGEKKRKVQINKHLWSLSECERTQIGGQGWDRLHCTLVASCTAYQAVDTGQNYKTDTRETPGSSIFTQQFLNQENVTKNISN